MRYSIATIVTGLSVGILITRQGIQYFCDVHIVRHCLRTRLNHMYCQGGFHSIQRHINYKVYCR